MTPPTQPVAIIDIGSNSVRLVVYDGLKRSPTAIFNEKVLCELAKNIGISGVLNPDGVIKASRAIARFVKISEFMQVKSLNLFATSAVRDATDGEKFVQEMNKQYSVVIDIVSGEDEAKYSALGITSSIINPKGVVGDLGGGSFELAKINGNEINYSSSYPIGPLRFSDSKLSRIEVKQIVKDHIGEFQLKDHLKNKNFYPVGGAFRNLAKIHMYRTNYPLKVIHNYKVSADELYDTAKLVSKMGKEQLSKIEGISSKRIKYIPFAATLIKEIIKQGSPKNIIFSTSGVREGYLFSKLDDLTQQEDPLICGSEAIMKRMMVDVDYAYGVNKWLNPLFADDDCKNLGRLRMAACIMSDISSYENSEYRADLAYRKIIDSSLIGLNHKERVFIAKSVYSRYKIYTGDVMLSGISSLIGSRKTHKAQIIGAATRLARTLSANSTEVLSKTSLENSKKKLILNIDSSISDIAGESVDKRLSQLSEILGKSFKVRIF